MIGLGELIQVPDGRVAGNAIGNTGNQMFDVTAAMTYAKLTGRSFIGMTKTQVKKDYPQYIMKTIMRNVKWVDLEVVNNFKRVGGNNTFLCNGFPNIADKDVYLNDYFQDSRCIDKEIAYNLFKPYNNILNVLYELYPDINDMVCVQVRRGDYLNHHDFNHYEKPELEKIINEIFPNDKILFVSNDITWCKNNFYGEKFHFADKEYVSSVEMDLYLQTQSKANVISCSTFGWWGAYLNERSEKVVCHWPWFKPGKINEMKYVLPDNWIKFEY